MHRHRHVGIAGVAQRVVLVRRDQAAGAAAVAVQGLLRGEAVAVALPFQQRIGGDDQLALPDPFHAPHCIVVVQRRALPRAPAHGDDAVAQGRAAVQFAACVVAVHRAAHARRQFDERIDDGLAQHLLQGVGDQRRIRQADRAVDGRQQAIPARERQWCGCSWCESRSHVGQSRRAGLTECFQSFIFSRWCELRQL